MPGVRARSKESTLSPPAAKRNNPPRFSFLLTAFLLILPAVSARGQTVTATVSAGTGTFAMAVNPVTNKIYVANTGSAQLVGAGERDIEGDDLVRVPGGGFFLEPEILTPAKEVSDAPEGRIQEDEPERGGEGPQRL